VILDICSRETEAAVSYCCYGGFGRLEMIWNQQQLSSSQIVNSLHMLEIEWIAA